MQIIDDYLGNLDAIFTFSEDGRELSLTMRKTAEDFLDEYKGDAARPPSIGLLVKCNREMEGRAAIQRALLFFPLVHSGNFSPWPPLPFFLNKSGTSAPSRSG